MPITMWDNNASITITEEGDGLMKDVRFTQSNFLYHHKVDDPIDAHYTFGALLGEGGFGVVYKGTHKKTGAERAIKRMEKDPRDRELNEIIIQEFDFLKELDHPNLIKVYDMFEAKVDFHIVTDLYGGGDLIDYLEEKSRLTEKDVQVFMNKLLSCIEYLHDSKLMVHRDLKLENVLLDTDQDLADMKLIDFGLARHFTPEDTFYELVGSTAYVAPQVIEGEYTAKCDIWSCGVIAYCLLCGYTPFEGYDDGQTLQAILIGRFDFNDPAWDPISKEGKDFICNLLAYEEGERPSAKQALRHPWLSGYRAFDESTQDLNTSLRESLQGLKRFRSKGCKLKQAACAILASQVLKKEEKEAINADFQFLNRSLSGTITRDDLRQALSDVDMDSGDYTIESILEQVNFSGSGAVSYSEFTIAMMFERDIVDDKTLRLLFNMLDTDGDDAISSSDLQAALQMPEETCAAMLAPFGPGSNVTLSFEQFTEAILADETMDGSNFLNSSFRMDDFSGRRRMEASISEIPDTVLEGDEDLPEESAHEEEPAPVPEPEPEPTKPEEPAEPEGMSDERLFLCFHWYMRFGHPDKKTMLRRVEKMSDVCPLTKEDVEALPWACGGAIIPVKEINKINQRNVSADGDITNKRASLRASATKKDAATEAAAKVAAEFDSSERSENNPPQENKSAEVQEKAPNPVKPSVLKAKTKEAKAKNMEFKPAFLKTSVYKADQKPLQVSSVLVGGIKDALTTKMTINAAHSETGTTETIVKKRQAMPRKEVTIFSNKKAARDFDWKSTENKELMVASPEERKEIKPDFNWVCIAKTDKEEPPPKNVVEKPVKVVEEPVKVLVEEPEKIVEEPVKVMEEPVKVVEEPVKVVEEPIKVEVIAKPVKKVPMNVVINKEPVIKEPVKKPAQEEESKLDIDESEMDDSFQPDGGMCVSERVSKSPAGSNMDDSEMDISEQQRRGMSASEPGGGERRSSTRVWLPGAKSAESQSMRFPKNRRRSSAMPGSIAGGGTRQSISGTGKRRVVPGRNKTG